MEANARLTGSTAAVLFVLLAAEGITIVRVRALLAPHVFIGVLLLPPVALKIGSTSYRIVCYYRGSTAYRRKGPPPVTLRLVGPFVVVLTVVVLGSGIALLLVRPPMRPSLLLLHKASFVLWFGAMAIHVLGHVLDTARLAPRDWMSRTRREVAGAGLRQWTLVSTVVAGIVLGLLFLGPVRPWLASSASHLASPLHRRPQGDGPTANRAPPPSAGSRAIPPAPTSVPAASAPHGSQPSPGRQGSGASHRKTSAHRPKSRVHRHGRKLRG